MSRSQRRAMIDREEPKLSLVRQCALLGISRSSLYYLPTEAGAEDLELMALIDQQYLKTPFYGSRRMTAWLSNHGHQVNRKRVRRLMQLIGLEAIYRRPAIMDWHSRYVLAWRLSNTLEVDFCVAALEEALSKGRPQIFNTDQGSQFTSEAFTSLLLAQGVQVSMDGRGRCMDNVFVERLWRSIKYEEVYLKAYQNGTEARKGIGAYLAFYNQERPHQALGYRSPGQVFQAVSPETCLLEHPRALPSDEGLRVHDVDLRVCVAVTERLERDAASVRRPAWGPVKPWVIGQSCLAGTVRVHHVYLTVPVTQRVERDAASVRRPAWGPVKHRVIGQSCLAGTVRAHHVYLTVPVTQRVERDAASVRRPAWGPVKHRVIGQSCLAGTVRAHPVDLRVPVMPPLERDVRWRRWLAGQDKQHDQRGQANSRRGGGSQ